MEPREDLEAILANRAYVYRLFQALFGGEPSAEQMEIVLSNTSRQALAVFAAEEGSAYATALWSAEKAMDAIGEPSDCILESLSREYMRLFVGPNKLVAPPWESVYSTRERLLFQKSTLAVRKAYLEQGLRAKEYPHVADDHISLEFDFMGHLASRAKDAYEAGRVEESAEALSASARFLKEHMRAWLPAYAEDISRADGARFYPAMVLLANEFIAVDEILLEEIAFVMER